MKKFNLALLPATMGPQALCLAQEFASFSDSYLLGQGSQPHVTLCQFYTEETLVGELWEKASRVFSEKALRLEFKRVEAVLHKDRLWVQLVPEPLERLQQLHSQVADMVKDPLGLVFEDYYPHLSLANIKKNHQATAAAKVETIQADFSDKFILSLGRCDEVGQFTQSLYQ